MKDAAALGGQGAANQVYNAAFWMFSVLPSVVSPLIAKAHGANDQEAVKKRVAEATFIAIIAGIIGTCFLAINPGNALSIVLTPEAPTRIYAVPYLFCRGIGGKLQLILYSLIPSHSSILFYLTDHSNASDFIDHGLLCLPRNDGCHHSTQSLIDCKHGQHHS